MHEAIDQSHGDVVPPPRVLEGRISDGQRVGVRGSGMVTPTSSWSRPLVRKRTDEAAVVEYGSGASWEVEVIQLDPAEPSVTTTSGRREFSVESVGFDVRDRWQRLVVRWRGLCRLLETEHWFSLSFSHCLEFVPWRCPVQHFPLCFHCSC